MAKKIWLLLCIMCLSFIVMAWRYPMPISIQAPSKANSHPTNSEEQNKQTNVTKTAKQNKSDKLKLPDVALTDWNLLLVNHDHPVDESKIDRQLAAVTESEQLDKRVIPAYNDLAAAAKKAGYELVFISGYRSLDDQKAVYQSDIDKYTSQGDSASEAKEKTGNYVAVPGTSEHQTGLAFDVLEAKWYQKGRLLEPEFGKTKAAQWLANHAPEFGFVIRYLEGKEAITNINYEPWHLRYVGKKNAQYMATHKLTLEEYVEKLKSR